MQKNLKKRLNFNIELIPDWFTRYERSFKQLIFVASFKNGINLKIDDRLIYIGCDETPFSLTLSEQVTYDWSVIDENSLAYIKEQKIYIQNQSVNIVCDYSRANIVDYRGLRSPISRRNLVSIYRSISDIKAINGFGMTPKDYVYSAQENQFELSKLIGKGLGLTPSGDDFIVGVFFAQALINCNQLILDDTVDVVDFDTTIISREYLKYACDSTFSKRLLDLFTIGDNEEVSVYIDRIKEVGHTSGLDTLSGILYVLDKEVSYEKNSSSIRW